MQNDLCLIADVGGTHARFALGQHRAGKPEIRHVSVYSCDAFARIEEAVEHYLNEREKPPLSSACFAVAAPIDGNSIRFTNNDWVVEVNQLKQILNVPQVKVVNDFVAMALGCTVCPARGLIPTSPDKLNHWKAEANAPKLVLGPGTGLGMSALIPDQQGQWIALPTEGGHMTFAPGTEEELPVLNYLWTKYQRVSWERLISGEGLSNLYEAWSFIKGKQARSLKPEQITNEAKEDSSSLSFHVVNHFCELLGRVSGDAALMVGARGGVYLCGGILPKITTLFQSSPFREAFEEKGRMKEYVRDVPTFLVPDQLTGLKGALVAIDNPYC